MDCLNACRSQPPLWHIDDSLKSQIVGRLADQPQIGNGMTDFRPLLDTCADNPVGKANRDETFLEFTGLKPGPDQNGNL